MAIKPAGYWHKNNMKSSGKEQRTWDINPHSCVHLIFDKGTKNI
jgi:hypothetical protein